MVKKPGAPAGDDIKQPPAPAGADAISPKLAALAKDIRDEHRAAAAAIKAAIAHAMNAGDFLLEAKAAVGHGEWLPYLKHVEMKERTAQVYMTCARNRAAIEGMMRQGIDVTVRNVSKLLAGPKDDANRSPAERGGDPGKPNVVELIPPNKKNNGKPPPANDAFSLGALPVEQEENILRGHAVLNARGVIEALTQELNGGDGAPVENEAEQTDPVEPLARTEDDALDYLVTLLIEKAIDAGETTEVVRDLLLSDAASCAPAFRRPQRWLDFLRTRADGVDEQPDLPPDLPPDLKSGRR